LNIDKIIKIIQDNEPENGYKLSFSGGKDSVVLYDLVVKSGVKFKAEFFNTGIEYQETYKFIRKFYADVKWLNAPKSFWQGIIDKGLPSFKVRWCCDSLKKVHNKNGNTYLIGIRADESVKRKAKYKEYVEGCHKKEIFKIYPLLWWTNEDIWQYINNEKLSFNELYNKGFNRIGCIGCPLQGKKRMRQEIESQPKFKTALINAIEKYLERLKVENKVNFFTKKNMTSVDVYNWYVKNDVKQGSLF
jgi:phosphoadenosine phosphosulfate reductase